MAKTQTVKVEGKLSFLIVGTKTSHREVRQIILEGLRDIVDKIDARAIFNDCEYEVRRGSPPKSEPIDPLLNEYANPER